MNVVFVVSFERTTKLNQGSLKVTFVPNSKLPCLILTSGLVASPSMISSYFSLAKLSS